MGMVQVMNIERVLSFEHLISQIILHDLSGVVVRKRRRETYLRDLLIFVPDLAGKVPRNSFLLLL